MQQKRDVSTVVSTDNAEITWLIKKDFMISVRIKASRCNLVIFHSWGLGKICLKSFIGSVMKTLSSAC